MLTTYYKQYVKNIYLYRNTFEYANELFLLQKISFRTTVGHTIVLLRPDNLQHIVIIFAHHTCHNSTDGLRIRFSGSSPQNRWAKPMPFVQIYSSYCHLLLFLPSRSSTLTTILFLLLVLELKGGEVNILLNNDTFVFGGGLTVTSTNTLPDRRVPVSATLL